MKQQEIRYAFCYEKEIGVLIKGDFFPLKFNYVTFLRKVVNYLRDAKQLSADVVLKKAIVEYCRADRLGKICQNKVLSDSEFFNYYKKMIMKKPKYAELFTKNMQKRLAILRDQEAQRSLYSFAAQRPPCKSILYSSRNRRGRC